ncbi:MAG TPA: nuclear transport factor 2 family protein [Candidatus Sulfotelmatobacter sp.]|nr:nuclear transport factor 2 family protein [Candidatus Sulfotelmatobacter sp.]
MYRSYSGSEADSRSSRSVESQLRDQTQDFAMSFNTGNYDHAAALFADDGALMIPSREAAYGRKQVENSLRQLADAGYGSLRLETLRIDHSGDMAMELGRFMVQVERADGSTVAESGSYVKVWRRLGAWLIVAECWTKTLQALRGKAA